MTKIVRDGEIFVPAPLIGVVGKDLDRAVRASGAGDSVRTHARDRRRGEFGIAAIPQRDSHPIVVVDAVPADRVVHGGDVIHQHTALSVVGDDIPCAGCVTPDDVVSSAVADVHAAKAVAYTCCATGVGADVIAADGVVHRTSALYEHTVAIVAADDIALVRRVAADGVVTGPPGKIDAAAIIAQVAGAAGVRADIVAADGVVAGIAVLNTDTTAVAADDIALARRVTTDDVVASAVVDGYPIGGVADNRRAADVGADIVARDGVGESVAAMEPYSLARYATADQVALFGCVAADQVMMPTVDGDPVIAVRLGERARRVGADEIAGDDIVSRVLVDRHTIKVVADDVIWANRVIAGPSSDPDAIQVTRVVQPPEHSPGRSSIG